MPIKNSNAVVLFEWENIQPQTFKRPTTMRTIKDKCEKRFYQIL